ncbi:hypothetical protein BC831DRAFT_474817 [Entophlyctis helioformis]|nr:hypothetical protein BC831DRAFT_474817 [Entophlyctis helioformis]
MQPLTAFVALLAAATSVTAQAGAQCANPYTRSEWRQLSAGQQQAYLRALDGVKNRPPSAGGNPAQWNLEQFTKLHWDMQNPTHGFAAFFPYHRRYLYWFERALRTVDPSVSIPYWDWTLDSQNPAASDILSPRAFGGNGRASDNCVADGVTAQWTYTYPAPAPCLKRCSRWSILWGAGAVNNIITGQTTFGGFRSRVEGGPHASVHDQGGGDCGYLSRMSSPNDPIFFLHHAMIDRIWWRWQTKCDGQYQYSYNNDNADPADLMPYFNEPVSSVLDTRAGPLCYVYSASRSDGDISTTCPNRSATLGGPTGTASRAAPTATATAAPTSPWLVNAVRNLLPKVLPSTAGRLAAPAPAPGGILGPVPGAVPAGPSPTPVRRPAKRDGAEAAAAAAVSAYPNADIVSRPTESAADKVAATATATATATMASGAYPTTAALPMPTYVPLANYTVKAPPAEDKKDLEHIRYPSAVSDKFIEMMRYDKRKIREYEIEAMHVVDQINNTPGYDSPSALKHFNEYNKEGRYDPVAGANKKAKCLPKKH